MAEPAPADAGGEDDGPRAHALAAVELTTSRAPGRCRRRVRVTRISAPRRLRLLQRAAAPARRPRRRSESRGSSRSATTCPAWPPGASRSIDERAQAFGGAVDRRREAGRAAADDRRCRTRVPRGCVCRPSVLGDVAHAAARSSACRRRRRRAGRSVVGERAARASACARSGASGVQPVVARSGCASRKRAQLAAGRVPAMPDHQRPRLRRRASRCPAGRRCARGPARHLRQHRRVTRRRARGTGAAEIRITRDGSAAR